MILFLMTNLYSASVASPFVHHLSSVILLLIFLTSLDAIRVPHPRKNDRPYPQQTHTNTQEDTHTRRYRGEDTSFLSLDPLLVTVLFAVQCLADKCALTHTATGLLRPWYQDTICGNKSRSAVTRR